MFNSIVMKTVKTSVLTVALLGASLSAQAETSLVSEVASNIEQNISAQMQDIVAKAQTELSLSIQSQMSEMMFELDSSEEIDASALAAEKVETPLVTSALVKD
ncbi:Conserved hypothetical protein [Shewanella piezotolerans WP3]|uniref:Uncharacterized protein n=1 Tax=Shewanella piezotolerans (strain WP3 / JCM 13877) TaxID=225849 RepID=B8CIS0_SHEPW|nr:hypothetical protein [Shewanella piezotolerans]ACJ27546.1 Conserved hypothetical protein [Shewanella piezotolerans WP3]